MTHSLHRRGNKKDLSNDFIMYIFPALKGGINREGCAPKKKKYFDIILRNGAVNIGGSSLEGNIIWNTPEELKSRIKDGGLVAACFACKDNLLNALKEIVDEDFGISIIISGIVEDIEDCLEQVGLKPHTLNHSLGIWGKTDLLPNEDILEITTMCGHGLVSTNLVLKCIDDVIKKRKSIEEAAKTLAQPCVCGLINVKRVEDKLRWFLTSVKQSDY